MEIVIYTHVYASSLITVLLTFLFIKTLVEVIRG